MIFKKIYEFKEAYNQGVLDSLRDNAYLITVILISLVQKMKIELDEQYNKIFNTVIEVLYEFNIEFRKLNLDVSDIEELFISYTDQLLDNVCNTYKDVYTPEGDSYKVLQNEYKLTSNQIAEIKKQYKLQIQENLYNLYQKNSKYLDHREYQNHLKKITSKL